MKICIFYFMILDKSKRKVTEFDFFLNLSIMIDQNKLMLKKYIIHINFFIPFHRTQQFKNTIGQFLNKTNTLFFVKRSIILPNKLFQSTFPKLINQHDTRLPKILFIGIINNTIPNKFIHPLYFIYNRIDLDIFY